MQLVMLVPAVLNLVATGWGISIAVQNWRRAKRLAERERLVAERAEQVREETSRCVAFIAAVAKPGSPVPPEIRRLAREALPLWASALVPFGDADTIH